jgi:ceramide glucosyltransferase
MPCKGDEPGLEANIEAVLNQKYENYYTAIVVDSPEDPAYAVAKAVLSRHPDENARVYFSEPLASASGKVAALLTALARDQSQAEVYAMVDSDARVSPAWLGNLVDPLKDDSVGAVSGFRWLFPSNRGFWSYVESAWNASGTNLLFNGRYNFPWGGAMAVRRNTLDEIQIGQVWSNALSDDLSLNAALRKHGYRTMFLPQCTVATFNQTGFHQFIKWATRQTGLTKAFNRSLWKYAAAAYAFLDFLFLLGIAGLAIGATVSPAFLLPAGLLLSPSVLGIFRGTQRNSTFRQAMPEFRDEFRRAELKEAIVSLIVPWVMTYCIIVSARLHEIEWRGRIYKLTEMNMLASS